MGAFAIPVVEAFPEIKAEYNVVIEYPMDFRTISEDRIHEYQEISERQYDLSMCFKNCMVFNPGTEYEAAAR